MAGLVWFKAGWPCKQQLLQGANMGPTSPPTCAPHPRGQACLCMLTTPAFRTSHQPPHLRTPASVRPTAPAIGMSAMVAPRPASAGAQLMTRTSRPITTKIWRTDEATGQLVITVKQCGTLLGSYVPDVRWPPAGPGNWRPPVRQCAPHDTQPLIRISQLGSPSWGGMLLSGVHTWNGPDQTCRRG